MTRNKQGYLVHNYVRSRISWMIRRDMAEVQQIEDSSFPNPWTETEFITCLRNRDCIGMVVIDDDVVIGFMIYELHKTRLHLLSMAVRPSHRRRGVATEMIQKLTSKLCFGRRGMIALEIRESNLEAQLLFRKLGFRATRVLRDFYEETNEAAYLFQYRKAAAEECEPKE